MAARQVSDPYRSFALAGMSLVSAAAAYLSFLHIQSLALRYGQPVIAAGILPLTIDGTIVVSSMSMLRAARSGLTTPALARVMLILSISATLACNVSYGLPHGIPGALLSAWPAVAFTGCAEISIGMSKRKASRIPTREAVTRLETDVTRELDVTASDGTESDVTARREIPAPGRLARQADQDSLALMVVTANPDVTFAELATELGVSESTARRVRARIENRVTSSNGASRT